jgi:hypothetical protein
MKTNAINYSLAKHYQFSVNEFNDDFYNPKLKYSLRHLAFIGNIPNETLVEALKKSLQICYLANINGKQHFKQVYLFNEAANTLQVDCFMSKNGFNLMLMQMPSVNEKLAVWLWKLSAL